MASRTDAAATPATSPSPTGTRMAAFSSANWAWSVVMTGLAQLMACIIVADDSPMVG